MHNNKYKKVKKEGENVKNRRGDFMKIEEKKFDYKFLNFLMYFGFSVAIFYFLKSIGIMDKIINSIIALVPVFIGVIICWASMPLSNKLRKLGINKNISAFISLIIIFGMIILIFAMLVPIFISELSNFIKDLPNIYNSIVEKINPILLEKFNIQNGMQNFQEIFSKDIIQNNLQKILNYSITTFQSIVNILITIVTTVVVSFFMVKDMDKFKDNFIIFFSRNSKNSKKYKMLIEMDQAVMSYIKGTIIDSVIVGMLTTVVCIILGLDYAIIFGILITILNLIPYIGAIISEFIVSIYALTVGGPVYAIITFICLFVVQLIDANILQPNIIAKSVNLHPVVVVGGLIVFNLLFGVIGMIIAMPTLAVIKIYLEYKFSIQFNEITNKE